MKRKEAGEWKWLNSKEQRQDDASLPSHKKIPFVLVDLQAEAIRISLTGLHDSMPIKRLSALDPGIIEKLPPAFLLLTRTCSRYPDRIPRKSAGNEIK